MGQYFDVVYAVGDLTGEVILEEIEAPEVGTIVQPRRLYSQVWNPVQHTYVNQAPANYHPAPHTYVNQTPTNYFPLAYYYRNRSYFSNI
ncbi:hypothetical protein MTR_4g119160 [Medicago truncatula]|uniref:Uncharacterized protein n=1 Tax=Medicago truncatula TaxID=3880 RepID=G7JK90_MEDTR|nr:hypothetical protein MTR_4g119160 [Medicago truncatula]